MDRSDAPPTSAGLADSNSSEEGVEHATPPPYGQMFATFMVCCMCGSSLFSMLSKKWGLSAESLLLRVFLASSLALSVPVFFAGNPTLTYVAFLVFECCVGIYFPAMGTMKSNIVPERATPPFSGNRVPLNVIVLGVLLNDEDECGVWLVVGTTSFGRCAAVSPYARISSSETAAVDVDAAEGSPTTSSARSTANDGLFLTANDGLF